MAEVYTVSVEWKPRREEPPELAVRLQQMLNHLPSIHPAFGQWLMSSRSPRINQLPFCREPADQAELAASIKRGNYVQKKRKKKLIWAFMFKPGRSWKPGSTASLFFG